MSIGLVGVEVRKPHTSQPHGVGMCAPTCHPFVPSHLFLLPLAEAPPPAPQRAGGGTFHVVPSQEQARLQEEAIIAAVAAAEALRGLSPIQEEKPVLVVEEPMW